MHKEPIWRADWFFLLLNLLKDMKKKIVLKIGTATIIERSIEEIVNNLVQIKNISENLALVSSGAVGYGRICMSKYSDKHKLYQKELAAIGQGALFAQYREYFAKHDVLVAQIMVTREICKITLTQLLEHKILPIINGNDPDNPIDLMYDDNDSLAGDAAIKSRADLLIIITDIDGVYDVNPKSNKNAKKHKLISEISDELLANSKDTGSSHGTGGMYTKLLTAQKLLNYDIDTYITSSFKDVKKFLTNSSKYKGTLISKN
jgi:glutamate 5-kinase